MAAVQGLPDGRYGRSADQRADRTLRIVGAVLGVVLLGVIAWFGYAYISGQDVSGRLIGFQVESASAVEIHLEVTKDKGDTGRCTVRALDAEHREVGRRDFTFAQDRGQVDQLVTVRTTARATSAELVGCDRATGR